jgi:CelD/BcsL family acetyltransferase involved in cellulose biosynthesis
MMSSSFSSEIICGWNSARALHQEWDELEQRIGVDHPFLGFSWLDCWINAYGTPETVHVLTVRRAGELSAVLPLSVGKKQIGCFPLDSCAFPGNGHSPRGGLLAAPDDHSSLDFAGSALSELRSRFDLCLFPAVAESSATLGMLNSLSDKGFVLHQEHTFDVPCFSLPNGWSGYVESKSKKFRKRLRESRAQTEGFGSVKFEVFGPGGIGLEALERLREVDRKSWQHANGTGLFSISENAAFYETKHLTFDVLVVG